jgi:long-chain fatty acid transport protein
VGCQGEISYLYLTIVVFSIWTNWSRFEELRVKFDSPENWKDTYGFGIGVNYAVNNALRFQTGVKYDPSPIREEFSTARLRGGDRTFVEIGATYQPSESFNTDIGYTHVFSDDSPINLQALQKGGSKVNLTAK